MTNSQKQWTAPRVLNVISPAQAETRLLDFATHCFTPLPLS